MEPWHWPCCRISSYASSISSRLTPKSSLAACVPAIDWKIIDSGAPRRTASICVVMWERTTTCVGISLRTMKSKTASAMSLVLAASSPTGLMPRQASPQPKLTASASPSTIVSGSSVVEFVCARKEIEPFCPISVLQWVV